MSQARVFRRVLVANRGEIAARVIRTCRRLGIETVLTVSDADAGSLPARLADYTIRIGPAPAAASYLDVSAVLAAAVAAKADALHPGYGFLSENARLARACQTAGVTFIGPSPETLEATGDKLSAREHAITAGLPVLPGGHVDDAVPQREEAGWRHEARRHLPGSAAPRRGGHDGHVDAAGQRSNGALARAGTATSADLAAVIGYPVLVKAAGGGGGRGLRVVRDPAELAHAVTVASAEALAAFGDARVYLERYVERGRHVEVQILGDGEHVIHLGDRDCSVQRRYQKLIEEAPAPGLSEELRDGLRGAAVALGEYLRYRGAGTVEFLLDTGRAEFYFLEVNARIQVEHPVTEAITGIDIVAEQIAIAEGRPLRFRQHDVTFDGHAIEVRVNAEDPVRDFLPSPGTVTRAVFPAGPGAAAGTSGARRNPGGADSGLDGGVIRVDSHLQAGATVPPYYDSLLAKVIAGDADRGGALAALRGALDRCAVDGVITNLDMQRAILADPEFAAGGVDTGYLARWLAGRAGDGAGTATADPVPDNPGLGAGHG
jgi:acetyl-CoA carboxylase biotin carboxylase subunit